MLTVHLFVSYAHVNLCHFFSSSWCRGSAAASASGSSWTFLFTLLIIKTFLAKSASVDLGFFVVILICAKVNYIAYGE